MLSGHRDSRGYAWQGLLIIRQHGLSTVPIVPGTGDIEIANGEEAVLPRFNR